MVFRILKDFIKEKYKAFYHPKDEKLIRKRAMTLACIYVMSTGLAAELFYLTDPLKSLEARKKKIQSLKEEASEK